MHRFQKFWQSLETLRGGATVAAEWEGRLGEEYALVRQWFRPTDELALAFPHRDPDRLYYRVVTHGPDDHVGVCDETGDRITLATAQLIVWELDRVALHRAVGAALGLVGEPAPVDHLPHTYRLGSYEPVAGYSFPAWLTIQSSKAQFGQVIDRLLATRDGPFLLLAPTSQFLCPAGEASLRQRQACFLPLDEGVALEDDGRLVATAVAERTLETCRSQVIPEKSPESAIAFFPTPAGATWAQVKLRLVDGHTVSVVVGSARGVFHYAELGLANRRSGSPSVQWELLRMFADGGGVLTWRSPGAGRRNQKRRELLARSLRQFLRIEGDPFLASGNGWRARFQILEAGDA